MKTGEIKTVEPETKVVPQLTETKTRAEFTVENTEIEVSIIEKPAAKFQVKERFIRFKKSLRKRSVSIL